MTMITPSYLGETIEYSSLHACRSTLEDPTVAASYTVTATNSGGNVTAALTVSIAAAPLLNLGHGTSIAALRMNGTQVLSQDFGGHWVIWDQSTHGQIASGDVCSGTCLFPNPYPSPVLPVDMAGPTVVIATPTGLDIRAASDGHLLATIAETDLAWWQLSSDGSYVSGATTTTLEVWSAATGQLIFSRGGDYSKTGPFSLPTKILVALGPAGANVVESIAVPSGISTLSPAFQGTFLHWFFDGGRFLTKDVNANRIYVYSNLSVQQDAVVINGSLATDVYGQGNSIWTFDSGLNTLTTYTVGSSASPSATFTAGNLSSLLPSGLMLALAGALNDQLSVLDFSTAAPPTRTDYTLPTGTTAFAGLTGSQWVAASGTGAILDGVQAASLGYFNYGGLASIVGSTTNYAIATYTGKILYFDAATNAQLGSINQLATNLALSTDGSLLFALVTSGVNVYSLPSGTLTNSYIFNTNYLAASASGGYVALPEAGLSVIPSNSTTPVWSVNTVGNPLLSPDGSTVAVSLWPRGFGSEFNVSVYKNGTLLNSARAGAAIGWVDNNRLIVNSYDVNREPSFTGASIYDPTGALISTLSIPMLNTFQVVSPLQAAPDLIYSPELNSIFSLTTGAATWSSASPGAQKNINIGEFLQYGAFASQQVVFQSNYLLLGEPD